MYIPKPNAVNDRATIEKMVASAGAASFVTTGDDGFPEATFLPIIWSGDRVVAHMARANKHWRHIAPGSPCLLIVGGADSYVSPGWQPSKARHGRVAPTWNYESVLIRGTAVIHDDPSWLRSAVTMLTDVHEEGFAEPWHVDDAPEAFTAGQLRGIVGVEITVEDVRAKSKLSQGRADDDHAGIVNGLCLTGRDRDRAVAEAMQAARGTIAAGEER
jgi:transcriptional regulator